MSILDQIRQRAASNPQHIVLPEGEDPRTALAASTAARQRLARITILGDEEKVRAAARQAGSDLGGVELVQNFGRYAGIRNSRSWITAPPVAALYDGRPRLVPRSRRGV